MNQVPNSIEAALQGLSVRLQAMNSDELGRVAEVARAGRTAIWRLRQGKSGSRVPTIARIEEAVGIVEAERQIKAS